jgi:Ca2+-binding RTX toxin-like protein
MPLYSSALKPFVFDSTDLAFILGQVTFRPLFDASGNPLFNWNGTTAIYDQNHLLIWNGSSALTGVGTLAERAIAHFGTSYQSPTDLAGLRDVTGNYNNLSLVHSTWGAVDQNFVRSAHSDYAHYAPIFSGTAGVYSSTAFAALNSYWGTYSDGSATDGTPTGSFNVNHTLNTDYTVTIGTAADPLAADGVTHVHVSNVVDYTPRMISLATTTAGVTYDTWGAPAHAGDPLLANHSPTEIYYNPTTGLPTVTNWGSLETTALGGLGQVDTQARFAGSAGEGDHFIGALNPGVSPSNGFFVLFGQFFDHGLDFIDKGGQGATIKITLASDDPLYGMTGSDGRPVHEITIARATINNVDANGAEYVNHTSPYIDQSQTYGSHEQLTTLLRQWVVDPVTGLFHAGMKLFDGSTLATAWTDANGHLTHATLPTLNELRDHVEATGRDALTWEDVSNYRNRDTSGHVSTGTSGSALILDMNPRFDEANLHQGNATQDSRVDNAIAALNTWLSTSAHPAATLTLSSGGVLTLTGWVPGPALTGANALLPFVNFGDFSIKSTLDATAHSAVGDILLASVGDHYIAGDGRVNENFGLTSIHHIFHEEHNYQVGNLIEAIYREDAHNMAANPSDGHSQLHQFQIDTGHGMDAQGNYVNASGAITWDLDKMFNSAKLVVEMEYQHAAVDQYARNVTPNIQEFVGYSSSVNSAVTLEYAQAAFRFGHSTLRETIDTIDPTHGLTGKIMGYALRDAFLNPDGYANLGPASILLGMSHQQMNEVDEFVTPALNQGLLGQPLDLAAINIARGRDLGIPTLNDFRAAIGLVRYTSWQDFGQNMQHPTSLANFIAAYSLDGNQAKADAIVGLFNGTIVEGSLAAQGFTLAYATAFMSGGDEGFNHIDTWLGGLAEVHQPGGLLGETFDKVFVNQIESLMDGDRFYYLFRLAGQQFAEEVGNGQLKDIVERNTGLTHLNGNIFGYADQYIDFGATPDAANTTSNDHKYGNNALLTGSVGIYSNGGSTNANDGMDVVIGGVHYVQDTRLQETDVNSLYGQNGFTNLDGTPNSGAESSEVIVGTAGNDLIYAQGGDDTVYGEAGNDTIFGGFGIDRLYGGDGADTIYGGDNPDLIDGGAGDDFLYGESSGSDINGADQIIGGSGNDTIHGGIGIDKLSGGQGDDTIYGDQDTDPFTHGSDGNDYVDGGSGGDILYGDNGDDVLVGGADQDQMFGGNGDDIIRPGDTTGALTIGTDEVLGGDGVTDEGNAPGTTGFDLVDFSDNTVRPGGVTFDLLNQANPGTTLNGTPTQIATFQVEGVVGSAGGDTIHGDDNDNWLIGGSGNDLIDGGLGNDVIVGGSVRLDALIGSYHQNGGAGAASAYNTYDEYAGASHRVAATDALTGGILAAANAQLTGVDYASHFTEMLKSDQFKDQMLGDGGATAGSDTLVLSGNRADYQVQFVTGTGHNVVRLTDTVSGRDGSDLVIDVANFRFADGSVSFAALQNTARASFTAGTTTVSAVEGTAPATPTTVRTFTVTLNHALANGVTATVDYSTLDGTAVAGSDYIASSGTLTFYGPGVPGHAASSSQTISITVLGDSIHENDELFTVGLSNGHNLTLGAGAITATGIILNDDALPSMSVTPASIVEGDVGSTTVALTITLNAPSDTPTTVHYATADGTATAGADYTAISGDVVFAPGETSKTVLVSISGDVLDEANELFSFNLTSANTLNASASALVTIIDNDASPVASINTVTVTEGNAGVSTMTFTATLSSASAQTVTLNYAAANGTAMAGSDYVDHTPHLGQITFAPGQTSATITYDIVGDTIHETPVEFYTVALSNPTNATIGNGVGVGFIADNDAAILTPVALAAMSEDGTRVITANELMAGVTNNQSATLTISALSLAFGSGTLTDLGGGTWAYKPADNDDTQAAFIYTATDSGSSWTGTASLDILPVNDAPVVANALANQASPEDASLIITLPTTVFTDIDSPVLTLSAALAGGGALPSWLAFNPGTRVFSGTPPLNFNGSLSVAVTATDSGGLSATSTFTLNITPVNDAPVAAAGVASTNEDVAVIGTVSASDVDIGNVLTYALVPESALGGTVTSFNTATGAYTFTPTPNYNGAASFQFTANDGTVNSNAATVSIVVNPVADPVGPITLSGPANVNEIAAIGTTIASANAVDPDFGSTITYALTDNAGGRFTISASTGVISVANGILLDFEQAASHNVTIQATSSDGSTSSSTVAINVLNVTPENIVGTAASETVVGGTGNDSFAMMGGNNNITGGAGSDSVSYAAATAAVTVDLVAGTAANGFGGTDTLATVENIVGGSLDDVIIGNAADNALSGGDGNDRLVGGAGNNSLIGGAGRDTADYSAATGGVFVNLNSSSAANNGMGGSDVVSQVEDVIGSALDDILLGNAGANSLTGGTGSDYLIGLDGNDVLSGGTGVANTLQGGAGDDTYFLGAVGDSVVEFANEGIDTVNASLTLSPYTLSANVENLVYTGAGNFIGVGNGLDNVITGDTGADYLIGFGGNDTLIGGTGAANTLQGGIGDDTYFVSAAGDSIIEFVGEGTDTVHTIMSSHILKDNVENLIYDGSVSFTGTGNAGNNSITGGVGADVLNGLLGKDTLTGGLGADVFRFDGGDGGQDIISDFVSGVDKIALNGAAFAHTAGIDLIQSNASAVATSTNSTFIYNSTTGALFYDADGTGAGAALAVANLGAGLALTTSDFMFFF